MKQLTLALDWTPNINHYGFLVAKQLNFYAEVGLEVRITHPGNDHYALTPAKKVENGVADFALCPLESVISYRTKTQPCKLQAAATIFQKDLSAIAVAAESTIMRPADLDGKGYASYQARYEDGIVKQMIKNDGGQGDLKITYPQKLGIWNTILRGETHSTWIFENWEGVEAQQKNVELRLFKMHDYGIPYSYSPVLACEQERAQKKEASYRAFLQATKKGFRHALDHPQEALDILRAQLPQADKDLDLQEALERSLPALGDADSWGKMELTNLESFLNWLRLHKLEHSRIQPHELLAQNLQKHL